MDELNAVEVVQEYIINHFNELNDEDRQALHILTQRRADGWVDVRDRLPEWEECRGNRVIVYFDNGVVDTWNPIGIAENLKTDRAPTKVTYWMPLPQPPKKGE